LDAIGVAKRLTLILHTRGGDGMAAWSLFNLLKMFCDELEVVIPFKAHSAGTMMAIGADKIIMTKQATLSPIDPSINHPLAPQIQGAPVGSRMPVSVEAISGYLKLAKDTLGDADKNAMSNIMLDLARQVHPMVLGDTFRRRQQTQLLAEKLLSHVKDADNRKKILSFLSTESGSHDYTLNRREATSLGLPITNCPENLYAPVNGVYKNFREEMKLKTSFNADIFPRNAVTPFANLRAIVESTAAAPFHFITEGQVSRNDAPAGEVKMITVTSEGWRQIS
jgi:hypothetical protein